MMLSVVACFVVVYDVVVMLFFWTLFVCVSWDNDFTVQGTPRKHKFLLLLLLRSVNITTKNLNMLLVTH